MPLYRQQIVPDKRKTVAQLDRKAVNEQLDAPEQPDNTEEDTEPSGGAGV